MKNTSKFFKDSKGHVAVWQRPNLLLITWIVATVLQKVFSHGTSYKLFAAIAYGSIFAWAWLEIFKGASYFRRLLGLVVLIASIYSRTK